MASIVALGPASFRPTSSVAKLSALGDDFPPDCCLLAGIRQSPSSSPRAHTALEDKEKWRGTADEDGHYCFAVAL
jgi:hypothetical protein